MFDLNIAKKLLSRTRKQWCESTNDHCWIWTGLKNEKGYARIGINGKHLKAHRVSYQVFKGDLIDGLVIDHICNKRCCINPRHLQQITQTKNLELKLSRQKEVQK